MSEQLDRLVGRWKLFWMSLRFLCHRDARLFRVTEEVKLKQLLGDGPYRASDFLPPKETPSALEFHTEEGVTEYPLIDCSVTPDLPKGWEIRSEDQIATAYHGLVDPKSIVLYLDNTQRRTGIRGLTLKKKLKTQPVLPACVLDYLLAHPELIPNAWKQDDRGNTRYIISGVRSIVVRTATCTFATCTGTAVTGDGAAAGSTTSGTFGTRPRSS